MRLVGVEPTRAFAHTLLRRVRLPVPTQPPTAFHSHAPSLTLRHAPFNRSLERLNDMVAGGQYSLDGEQEFRGNLALSIASNSAPKQQHATFNLPVGVPVLFIITPSHQFPGISPNRKLIVEHASPLQDFREVAFDERQLRLLKECPQCRLLQ